jgi:hypothetical protein
MVTPRVECIDTYYRPAGLGFSGQSRGYRPCMARTDRAQEQAEKAAVQLPLSEAGQGESEGFEEAELCPSLVEWDYCDHERSSGRGLRSAL